MWMSGRETTASEPRDRGCSGSEMVEIRSIGGRRRLVLFGGLDLGVGSCVGFGWCWGLKGEWGISGSRDRASVQGFDAGKTKERLTVDFLLVDGFEVVVVVGVAFAVAGCG